MYVCTVRAISHLAPLQKHAQLDIYLTLFTPTALQCSNCPWPPCSQINWHSRSIKTVKSRTSELSVWFAVLCICTVSARPHTFRSTDSSPASSADSRKSDVDSTRGASRCRSGWTSGDSRRRRSDTGSAGCVLSSPARRCAFPAVAGHSADICCRQRTAGLAGSCCRCCVRPCTVWWAVPCTRGTADMSAPATHLGVPPLAFFPRRTVAAWPWHSCWK